MTPGRFLSEEILRWLGDFLDMYARRQSGDVVSGALRQELNDRWAALIDVSSAPPANTLAATRGRLGLDADDILVLLLAVAPYLETSFRDRFKQLQQSILADRCSVALALELLRDDPTDRLLAMDRFDDTRLLFAQGLVTLEPAPNAHGDALLDQVLCVPQRTVDHLLARARLDEKVRAYCAIEETEVALEQVIVPPKRRTEVLQLVSHHEEYRRAQRSMGFDRAIPYGRGIVLLFSGPPGTGKTLFARALAARLSRPLIRVFADKLAESTEAIEPVVISLFRDANLHGAVTFFDECEGLFQKRGTKLGFLLAELDRFEGILILATNQPQLIDEAMDRRIVYRMDFERPSTVEREQIWEIHLPPGAPLDPDVDIPLLANLYNFTGGLIKNAVLVALNKAIARDPTDPRIDMELLKEASVSQLKYNLESYANKSQVELTMDDLVLPEEERRKIDEIIAACRNKDFVQNKWGFGRRLVTGKGISILFDGPPGTGKTLCAEILAKELERPLYRVHIPNVVSKWMGETEKNISEIFTRALASHAMLLFDEADSLFGKRTEVKSSNDRFANQEVNLLLQEIERFTGITLMTTNLFGGLDDALKRRIQYRVTFTLPDADERAKVWEVLMPHEAPVAKDVDYALLAKRFEIAGGNIKNAIVRAAYRACEDGTDITMSHLREAARWECEAIGKLVRDAPDAKPKLVSAPD